MMSAREKGKEEARRAGRRLALLHRARKQGKRGSPREGEGAARVKLGAQTELGRWKLGQQAENREGEEKILVFFQFYF